MIYFFLVLYSDGNAEILIYRCFKLHEIDSVIPSDDSDEVRRNNALRQFGF